MTISGDPLKMKPYRIEWRSDLTTQWVRLIELDEHPGDLKAYVKARKGWNYEGQWRLVSQHVISASGLGA